MLHIIFATDFYFIVYLRIIGKLVNKIQLKWAILPIITLENLPFSLIFIPHIHHISIFNLEIPKMQWNLYTFWLYFDYPIRLVTTSPINFHCDTLQMKWLMCKLSWILIPWWCLIWLIVQCAGLVTWWQVQLVSDPTIC